MSEVDKVNTKVVTVESKRDLDIWNAAIEAAAEKLEQYCRAQKNNQDETTVAYSIEQIRSLKK